MIRATAWESKESTQAARQCADSVESGAGETETTKGVGTQAYRRACPRLGIEAFDAGVHTSRRCAQLHLFPSSCNSDRRRQGPLLACTQRRRSKQVQCQQTGGTRLSRGISPCWGTCRCSLRVSRAHCSTVGRRAQLQRTRSFLEGGPATDRQSDIYAPNRP